MAELKDIKNSLPPRLLYSIKEIAVILGRSPWSVAEMVRTGALPYVPDGRRKFVDIRDVHKWIDNSKVTDLD